MPRLTTEKTKPKTDLSQMIVLMYGPAKIGKSTWASTAPGAIFVPTEPGLAQLSVSKTIAPSKDCCEDWDDVVDGVEDLLADAKEIPAEEDPFKTVIIDTVDEFTELAAEDVIEQHNRKAQKKAEHISDIPFGKGYAQLWQKCKGVIRKLARSRYGLVLIAHSYEVTKEDANGDYQVTVPALAGKLRTQIEGMADLILLADTVSEGGVEKRILHTKPSRFHVAGDRTGRLPAVLPLAFDAVADALRDEVREWAKGVFMRAKDHPGLKDNAAVMNALKSVVQVATGRTNDDEVIFDPSFLRDLDEETRGKIEQTVETEVANAIEAMKGLEEGPDSQPEATEGTDPTDDISEPEVQPEATDGPDKEGARGKGGKKKSSRKKKPPKNEEPAPEPEVDPGNLDAIEDFPEDDAPF